ncbi:hypothetical protein [Acinetobacter sp. YH12100]|uniref:hypothetical protein n=1 Tax=Acinetobacter sp. YH12100 TaxID=2601089 RepID=UPI0015D3C121|nr:hypothetical protein [Acinetobacter sp. YH12100]
MPIHLGYENADSDEIRVNGYILHPHNLLETWIVLTNPTLISSYDEEEQDFDITQVDLKEILEEIYNQYLPGLRVLSTKIFFLDSEGSDCNIGIEYKGQGIINTQNITITDYTLSAANSDDYRIHQARELVKKLS